MSQKTWINLAYLTYESKSLFNIASYFELKIALNEREKDFSLKFLGFVKKYLLNFFDRSSIAL